MCQPGYFDVNDGIIVNCQPCPTGTFSKGRGRQCTFCEPGTYSDKVGQSMCKYCIAGTFNPDHGAVNESSCRCCPAGFYGAENGADNVLDCKPCREGTYSTDPGSTNCTLCPLGYFSSRGGSFKS